MNTPGGVNRFDIREERMDAGANPATSTTWRRVVFSFELDEDDNCPVCGTDYAECPCPGPTQDDLFEYEEFDGVMYARMKEDSPSSKPK